MKHRMVSRNLNDVPPTLITHIILYLKPQCVFNLELTSKSLHQMLMKDEGHNPQDTWTTYGKSIKPDVQVFLERKKIHYKKYFLSHLRQSSTLPWNLELDISLELSSGGKQTEIIDIYESNQFLSVDMSSLELWNAEIDIPTWWISVKSNPVPEWLREGGDFFTISLKDPGQRKYANGDILNETWENDLFNQILASIGQDVQERTLVIEGIETECGYCSDFWPEDIKHLLEFLTARPEARCVLKSIQEMIKHG